MSTSAFLAAIETRDREAALSALSPAFLGKANGRVIDRDAQVRLVESFWTGFPDGKFVFQVTGGHGRQVITWTFAGTHAGTYLGVPATGATVALSGFIVAVSDESGVLTLDWKWDTKAFTKQVLGPDEVEEPPKPPGHRPDPSVRWAGEAQRGRGGGGRKPQRKGKPRKGPAQARAPQAAGAGASGEATAPAPGQAPASGGPTGPSEPAAPPAGPGGEPAGAPGPGST